MGPAYEGMKELLKDQVPSWEEDKYKFCFGRYEQKGEGDTVIIKWLCEKHYRILSTRGAVDDKATEIRSFDRAF